MLSRTAPSPGQDRGRMSAQPNWMMLRSFSKDSSVAEHKLAPGTVRRIVRFATPYKAQLGWFLFVVVLDALIGVITPLLFKQIIDEGIPQGDRGLVATLALIAVGLALFDAVLSLLQRWYSAHIGEGLIYDMRAR